MARVKRGMTASAKHKKIRDLAKGYYGAKHRWFRTANEAVMHAGQYAYRDRRNKKRTFRRLWITRINAAARLEGMSYSELMNGLNKAEVEVNGKSQTEQTRVVVRAGDKVTASFPKLVAAIGGAKEVAAAK